MEINLTPAQRKLIAETAFSLLFVGKGELSNTDPLVNLVINAAGECLTEIDLHNLRILLAQYLAYPLPIEMRDEYQAIMDLLDAAP